MKIIGLIASIVVVSTLAAALAALATRVSPVLGAGVVTGITTLVTLLAAFPLLLGLFGRD
jgi:hypothetical protein